ncbi:MAG: ECF transporter S component [Oscillospiraceae bacterium]|nr:ECF transporter S component [Oscillospiraceae bacterium]
MHQNVRKLTLSALFLALGLVLPFLTGQIREIGSMLLPMHIPVLLCGLICGWPWGAAVGLVLPLLRSVTFGMPPLYPTAVAMSLELLTYGLVVGLVWGLVRRQNLGTLYCALLAAMVAGRLVWGGAMVLLLGLQGGAFTWEAFLAGAVLNAVPGILVQLILIPAIMFALGRAGLLRFRRDKAQPEG